MPRQDAGRKPCSPGLSGSRLAADMVLGRDHDHGCAGGRPEPGRHGDIRPAGGGTYTVWWLLPGGKVEFGEPVAAAARRKAVRLSRMPRGPAIKLPRRRNHAWSATHRRHPRPIPFHESRRLASTFRDVAADRSVDAVSPAIRPASPPRHGKGTGSRTGMLRV